MHVSNQETRKITGPGNPLKPALMVLVLLAALLAGCAQSEKPGEPVKTFWGAVLAADKDKVLSTVCPEWEAQAQKEFDAFSGVTGKLDSAVCQKSGTDGAFTLVTCTGKMVLDYRGEQRERPLEGRTYLVKKVDGDWKLCGYR